ncbi:sensor domain-containing protein [Halorhabdus sp. BNX81]|uniref:sensor domain-containing protein n=1 Tax=Halorhabdus sp. BNX81 TaxID=2980181 RepID=UPI0023DD1EB4|nr:sensor domain-containing protein [Halorhabdus sp. BNX81]WEL20754.1 Sensor domain-containing protein [Halorhabdus sp. BNX81]
MTATSNRSLSRRILGVVVAKRTYRNLAYMFLRFPLGIAYFTLFLTGITLGIVLIPLVIGVPILIGVLGAADYAGVIETRIARGLLNVDATWTPTDADELSVRDYAKTVVTDRHNYGMVVYFPAQFIVGTVAFVALTLGLVIPLTLLVAPLVYWLPGVRYELLTGEGSTVELGALSIDSSAGAGGFGPIVIDTLPEALAASVVGVIVLLVALHLVNAVARVIGWLTCTIFSSSSQN